MTDGLTAQEPLYSLLPSVDSTLLRPELLALLKTQSRAALIEATRSVLRRLRTEIASGTHTRESLLSLINKIEVVIEEEVTRMARPTLVPVLNATGVILHTNLGRAPLSSGAIHAITEVARGYSNLEFDLATGRRGRRDRHAEPMLLRALGSMAGEQAEQIAEKWGLVIVNNCAAATFLALNSIAEGREVIVSRGELVEIGGGFRIPEILRKAGAILREVGTTNRTRLADYASAINSNTGMILRVHQSNFRMEGFTERPLLSELTALSKRTAVPLFDDQGTGLMMSLEDLGLKAEPSLIESFKNAPELIAASGDKLLGGPQCGLLLGRHDLIETIHVNPLYRVLRADKLTYAALEATLLSYAARQEEDVPTVRMLRISAESLRQRCQAACDQLTTEALQVSIVPTQSVIGGGTTAGASISGFGLSLRHTFHTSSAFIALLRRQTPPVIARVQNDCVLLDLRTIPTEQDEILIEILRTAARTSQ